MIVALLLACAGGGGAAPPTPPDTAGDTRTGPDTAADSGDSGDSGAVVSGSYAALLTRLELDLGVGERSLGFDLDGVEDACGVRDFRSDAGEVGIDNGFARYAPDAPDGRVAALQADISVGLAEGTTEAAFVLSELDDPHDDPEVVLTLVQASGELLHEADGGTVLPWQTLARGAPLGEPVGVALVDGVLETRALEVAVPLVMGHGPGRLPIAGGVRLVLPAGDPAEPDALTTGVLAGSVARADSSRRSCRRPRTRSSTISRTAGPVPASPSCSACRRRPSSSPGSEPGGGASGVRAATGRAAAGEERRGGAASPGSDQPRSRRRSGDPSGPSFQRKPSSR